MTFEAHTKATIEQMNERLLKAEGEVFALRSLVHTLFKTASATSPSLVDYLEKLRDTFEFDALDKPTQAFLDSARAVAESILKEDEGPRFTVIDGGRT